MEESLRLGKMLESLQTEVGYSEMKKYLCDVFAETIDVISKAERYDWRAFEVLVALKGYKTLIDELADSGNYPYPDVKAIVDM